MSSDGSIMLARVFTRMCSKKSTRPEIDEFSAFSQAPPHKCLSNLHFALSTSSTNMLLHIEAENTLLYTT